MDGSLRQGEIVKGLCNAGWCRRSDVKTVAIFKGEHVWLDGLGTVSFPSTKKVSGNFDGALVGVHCASNAVEPGGATELIERSREAHNRSILGVDDSTTVLGLHPESVYLIVPMPLSCLGRVQVQLWSAKR